MAGAGAAPLGRLSGVALFAYFTSREEAAAHAAAAAVWIDRTQAQPVLPLLLHGVLDGDFRSLEFALSLPSLAEILDVAKAIDGRIEKAKEMCDDDIIEEELLVAVRIRRGLGAESGDVTIEHPEVLVSLDGIALPLRKSLVHHGLGSFFL